MSNYTRAKTVVEALLDKSLTDEAFVSLMDNITNYQPAMDLSNEEKCGGFLVKWASQLKVVVRTNAELEVQRAALSEAEEAGQAAIAEL